MRIECAVHVFSIVRRSVLNHVISQVLIGVHGAGLGMMLYLPPNAAVVEIAPYGNDGRCLLGGGPFSRLATVTALNYLIHHPVYEEFRWEARSKTSELVSTQRFIESLDSFLKAIDFIDDRKPVNGTNTGYSS